MTGRPAASLRAHLLVTSALVVLTVVAFAHLRLHDFILYDDTLYVTENLRVQQGVTLANLRWAFTTMDAGYWHPLTWWSHMLDCEIFGLAAGGHHVTSLVLHVVAAVLLFVALHSMTGAIFRSAFVAALFAVHPLHVESVAYVAERKDVLSGVFFMLTLVAYARYARVPSPARYAAVVAAFVLGLMAKPMVVTLPFVLLLLDLWPLRRVTLPSPDRVAVRRVIAEKIPLLVLAALASVVTARESTRIGAVADLASVPFGARVATATLGYATYLGKTFWPAKLACFYPYPRSFDPTVLALAATVLVAGTVVAVLSAHRRPYLTVGWLWYVGMLVPVSGVVQVGQHAMADRYTYLPVVGIFLAVTWAVADAVGDAPGRRRVLGAVGALVLVVAVAKTRAEVAHWQNTITLFEHALTVTQRNHVAHNNLGLAYRNAKRFDEARQQFEAALAIDPGYEDARTNLALALRDLGRGGEAIASFRDAIRRNPGDASAHFNLGESLLLAGDAEGAVGELHAALGLDPDYADAEVQLGGAFRTLGRPEEAMAHARRALELRPSSAEAECYLADALSELGRVDDAVAHYERALTLRPDFADAHYNLGTTLARRGEMEAAITQFRAAVVAAPDHVAARNNLGRALAAQGRLDDAVAAYSEALRVRPDFAIALANRAQAYEQLGKSDLAAADRARAAAIDPGLR
jgi:tetratricopeptide (TPR) repeat protein